MADDKIYVGSVGTVFEVQLKDEAGTVVDLTGASVLKMRFVKPSGTAVEKTAVLSGTAAEGKISYTTIAGDLDVAGDWLVLGYVELPTWTGYSTPTHVEIHSVPAPVTNTRYASVEDLKVRLFPPGATDTVDDEILANILDAVSAKVDEVCKTRFAALNETRYFTAISPYLCIIDNLAGSPTTLATDDLGTRTYSTTWSSSDYELEPANASAEKKPYTRIAVPTNGGKVFPLYRRGVKVVGPFGFWTAVPANVREAVLLQSERLYKRKDAPFGVIGSADMGTVQVIPKLDPDVQWLLPKPRVSL